jgi:cell wall-associated NlpC family hydrolase
MKLAGVGAGYPRTTAAQRPWCEKNCARIEPIENVKRGDILFFNWGNGRYYGHTGIALGGDKFIHASSSKKKGVIQTLSSYAKASKGTVAYRLKG